MKKQRLFRGIHGANYDPVAYTPPAGYGADTKEDEVEEEVTLDTILGEDVELLLPLESYRRILAYVRGCSTEVSGFADVVFNAETRQFVVSEVYLIDQVGGATGVHISEEDISAFNLKMVKAGKTQLPRLWWHSHVNMGAFFSGIDEGTTSQLQNETFNISLVANKKFEMKAMMYVAVSMDVPTLGIKKTTHIKIDPLPVRISYTKKEFEAIWKGMDEEEKQELMGLILSDNPSLIHPPVSAEIVEEIEEKVKTQTLVPWNNPFKGFRKADTGYVKYTSPEDGDSEDIIKANARKNKMRNAKYLPKDPAAALMRVETNSLRRTWDLDFDEYVYEDPGNGTIWLDYWEVLGDKLEDTLPPQPNED